MQYEKAWSPIDVTLVGMDTEARSKHSQKAFVPIDVTLVGMDTEARPKHSKKAQSPIDMRFEFLGIVTEVRP